MRAGNSDDVRGFLSGRSAKPCNSVLPGHYLQYRRLRVPAFTFRRSDPERPVARTAKQRLPQVCKVTGLCQSMIKCRALAYELIFPFNAIAEPLAGPIEGISLQQLQQHFDWATAPVTVQRK